MSISANVRALMRQHAQQYGGLSIDRITLDLLLDALEAAERRNEELRKMLEAVVIPIEVLASQAEVAPFKELSADIQRALVEARNAIRSFTWSMVQQQDGAR